MSTRVEADEIHITRSEKALATVLAVFMLIGGLWVYFEPLDRLEGFDSYQPVKETPREAAAISEREAAAGELARARQAEEEARRNLEVRREAYRTELDAGRSGTGPESAFRRAEGDFARAERRTRESAAALARTRPAAERAERRLRVRQGRPTRAQPTGVTTASGPPSCFALLGCSRLWRQVSGFRTACAGAARAISPSASRSSASLPLRPC